jgi:hypothetical protein
MTAPKLTETTAPTSLVKNTPQTLPLMVAVQNTPRTKVSELVLQMA